MKNITVSLDDEIYRRVRARVAELDTSVSAHVKKYLIELVDKKTDFERRKRLQDEILAQIHGRSFSHD
jgi:DNA replication initiation complex subunit (GINS family)